MYEDEYREIADLIGQDNVGTALIGGYIKPEYTLDPELKQAIENAISGMATIKRIIGPYLEE